MLKNNTYYFLIPSFFLSVLLWFSLSFDQVYEIDKKVNLNFLVEKPFAVSNKVPLHIDVKLKGKGWSLLKYMTAIDIDVSFDVSKKSKDVFIFNTIDYLNEKLTDAQDVRISAAFPETLQVKLGIYEEKYVKVFPQVFIECKQGYQIVGKPVVEPDTILIGGAKEILNSLFVIPTENIYAGEVFTDVNRLVKISDSLSNIVRFYKEEIRFSLHIEPSGDRMYSNVEISVHNIPRDREVLLLPEVVEVHLKGGVNQLATLENNKIKAEIDFTEIIKDTTGSVTPVFSFPDGIVMLTSSPQKIQYIIKKKI